jgi:ferredoxin
VKPRIDKERCIGCAICENICPEGIKMVKGKAEIKDEKAECIKKAAYACPQKAIILSKKDDSKNNKEEKSRDEYDQYRPMGQGRGIGAGRGRGLGRGPRDGRGRGRGGGGRRR